MKAKDYLQQVRKLDMMINNKMVEIKQWKTIATGTSTHSEGDRVQTSGSQQKMADAVTRYVAIEQEIDADIDRLINIKFNVIRTIEQLPPIEYDLLHKVYIQFRPMDDVAEDYNKSYRWATTIHGMALQNVQKMLNKN